MLIAEDFNQDVSSERIQKFMRENRLVEVHETINNIEDNRKDNTHTKRSKQIDAIMATNGLMQVMRGSKITDFQDAMNADHRGFVIGLDVKDYFSIESSKYDQSDNVKLDSTKRSHREHFKDKLYEHIDQLKLEETMNSMCNGSITGQEIDRLDETITFVLNAAKKCAEGVKRTTPSSLQKVRIRKTCLYYEVLFKKKEGKNADENALKERREFLDLESEDMSRDEAEEKHEEALKNGMSSRKTKNRNVRKKW